MEVIFYFSDFFLWKKQWQKYDKDSAIFEYLYSNNTLQEIMPNDYLLASLKSRALAFSIDIALVIIVVSLLGGLSILSILGYYIIFQVLIFGFFDLPTPGNFISKIKVFEGHDKTKTTLIARAIRIMLISITLFTLEDLSHNLTLDFSSLVVIINIGLLLKYNKLIQDFSGTRLYDMFSFEKD